jgi:hypothetical protein
MSREEPNQRNPYGLPASQLSNKKTELVKSCLQEMVRDLSATKKSRTILQVRSESKTTKVVIEPNKSNDKSNEKSSEKSSEKLQSINRVKILRSEHSNRLKSFNLPIREKKRFMHAAPKFESIFDCDT